VRKLGEGAFGKVKLVFKGDEGKKYAVKIIKKDLLKRKREITRDERGSKFIQNILCIIQKESNIKLRLKKSSKKSQ